MAACPENQPSLKPIFLLSGLELRDNEADRNPVGHSCPIRLPLRGRVEMALRAVGASLRGDSRMR